MTSPSQSSTSSAAARRMGQSKNRTKRWPRYALRRTGWSGSRARPQRCATEELDRTQWPRWPGPGSPGRRQRHRPHRSPCRSRRTRSRPRPARCPDADPNARRRPPASTAGARVAAEGLDLTDQRGGPSVEAPERVVRAVPSPPRTSVSMRRSAQGWELRPPPKPRRARCSARAGPRVGGHRRDRDARHELLEDDETSESVDGLLARHRPPARGAQEIETDQPLHAAAPAPLACHPIEDRAARHT